MSDTQQTSDTKQTSDTQHTSNLTPDTADIAAEQRTRHGSSIGQPLTRREGRLKVTGAADYAADNHPPGMLHAVMAVASIARGRVTALDVATAEAHPGVVAVMTTANAPELAQSPDEKDNPFAFRLDLLQNDGVRYANQPIAVVIAETLEAATEGAALLAPRYAAETARVGLDGNTPFVPPAVGAGSPTEVGAGDVAAGLASAAKRIDVVYETASTYHNALEPHAIVTWWDGDALTLHTPSQGMSMAQGRLAKLFGIKPQDILIKSPYLGGGFGSKGLIAGPQVLGVMAARMVGKPVKLVMRREQMFGPVGHRGATRQTLKMGADANGALTAIDHHTLTATSSFDDFYEPAGLPTRHSYATGALATTHEGVRVDIGTPIFARAPGEAAGSVALGERDGRTRRRMRARSAGVPASQLRGTGADHRQAVLLEGPARMLPAGRGSLRLGRASAEAAPDAGFRRSAGRLGPRHRDLPRLHDGRGGQGGDPARRLLAGRDRRARHGPGRLDQSRADRRRRSSASTTRRWPSRSAVPTCRTAAWRADRRIRRPPARRSTTPPPTSCGN